jgi:DNA-binding HxlR family transcriptional regulator
MTPAIGNEVEGPRLSFGKHAEDPGFRLLGDHWALAILVATLDGVDKFEQIAVYLGIARNILADRLEKLIDWGLVEKHPYALRPLRNRYAPTARAQAFETVLSAAKAWSDASYAKS